MERVLDKIFFSPDGGWSTFIVAPKADFVTRVRGIESLKFVLMVFNLSIMLFISGYIVYLLCAYSEFTADPKPLIVGVHENKMETFTEFLFKLGWIYVVIYGILLMMVPCIGYIGTKKEDTSMLIAFGLLMLLEGLFDSICSSNVIVATLLFLFAVLAFALSIILRNAKGHYVQVLREEPVENYI